MVTKESVKEIPIWISVLCFFYVPFPGSGVKSS